MKSLIQFIQEAKDNQLSDTKIKELLKPYNDNDFHDFNSQNAEFWKYMKTSYKQHKVKDISKDLEPGDAFVDFMNENEYGGIYTINFGFINNDKTISFISFTMKSSYVDVIASIKNKYYIDSYSQCYYLDAMNLSGVEKIYNDNI